MLRTVIAGACLFISTSLVWPHDALPTAAKPTGWTYPFSCCSGYDCREVSNKNSSIKVTEGRDGYIISSTGEVVGYHDKKIKER